MNCLVTGASRGIGLAVAQRLASAGYGVTLCAKNADLLHQRKQELSVVRENQQHDVWALDFTDLEAVAQSKNAPRPLADFGSFVNCAGVAGSALSLVQSPSSIDATIRINLHSPILLAKNIAKAMVRNKERERQHILFMSSILGSKGVAGSAVYGATKAGLEAFTRSLAREVGSRGIAVNCVAPGLADTDMGQAADPKLMSSNVFPGLVPPESIAEMVEFLLKSKSITGQTVVVDNGCSI